MKRHRRRGLSDLFYNTGDLNERTVDESFGFSRQFTETVSEGMMEDERILRERLKKEQERAARNQNQQNQPSLPPNPVNQNPLNQGPSNQGPVNDKPTAE